MISDQSSFTKSVSIHAPTRGATQGKPQGATLYNGFNPRAHTRRDQFTLIIIDEAHKFQSTRPHEARLLVRIAPERDHKFQSTRPHEARHSDSVGRDILLCFNPRAHTRRDQPDTKDWRSCRFQSTRPHEARHRFYKRHCP